MAFQFAGPRVGGLPLEFEEEAGLPVSTGYAGNPENFDTLDAVWRRTDTSRLWLRMKTGQLPSSGASFEVTADHVSVPLAVGLCDRRDQTPGTAS